MAWVDLVAPTPDQAPQVGEALGLHPLIIEDVLEGNQRAKIETTDGIVHIVLFHLSYGETVVASELDIVLGEGFLLTVHNDGLGPARGAPPGGAASEPVLAHGPDHLLWAIADDLIDGYFPFADQIGDAIDDVQDQVVRKATPDIVEQLFKLKRELIQVRRTISPVREVFNQLTNRDETADRRRRDHLLPGHLRPRDPPDRRARQLPRARLVRARRLPTQVNNNLSVIMKRLTGVTVILAGIGAVAGIFGMSEAATAIKAARAAGSGRSPRSWSRRRRSPLSSCAGSTGSDGGLRATARLAPARREGRQRPGRLERRLEDDVGRRTDLVRHPVRPDDADRQAVDRRLIRVPRAGPPNPSASLTSSPNATTAPGRSSARSASKASRLPPAVRGRRSTTSRPR